MGFPNPVFFAAKAASLSDEGLYTILREIRPDAEVSDYEQAVLDEAQLRGLLTGSEVGAIAQRHQAWSFGARA